MSTQTSTSSVINELSYLIYQDLKIIASEQYQPSTDPDAYDEILKTSKTRVIHLREIRTQFENIMSNISQ